MGLNVYFLALEFKLLNAELDALLRCVSILEARGDRICLAARQLVDECQQSRGATTDRDNGA